LKSQTGPTVLLSDEPALEALLQRCLPSLRRWAHGKLPPIARGSIDTDDLVQEAALNAIKRIETFEPRHVGAMQAYFRRSVINRIRDEIRRVASRPMSQQLPEEIEAKDLTPLEQMIQGESYEHYLQGLQRLRAKDREIIVARVEAQWNVEELAENFGFRTTNAARVATDRAIERLRAAMQAEGTAPQRNS
jgi:RNA polymerase sigma-70 factor (ECF subfamily)